MSAISFRECIAALIAEHEHLETLNISLTRENGALRRELASQAPLLNKLRRLSGEAFEPEVTVICDEATFLPCHTHSRMRGDRLSQLQMVQSEPDARRLASVLKFTQRAGFPSFDSPRSWTPRCGDAALSTRAETETLSPLRAEGCRLFSVAEASVEAPQDLALPSEAINGDQSCDSTGTRNGSGELVEMRQQVCRLLADNDEYCGEKAELAFHIDQVQSEVLSSTSPTPIRSVTPPFASTPFSEEMLALHASVFGALHTVGHQHSVDTLEEELALPLAVAEASSSYHSRDVRVASTADVLHDW